MKNRIVQSIGAAAIVTMLWAGEAARADEFYALASAQTVTTSDGVAVRLTANGPVAFAVLPDPDAPPGAPRARLRLYGVNRVSEGVLAAVDGAVVTATPDQRGNLDVTVAATRPLDASRPFIVRSGPGTQAVDVVLRPAEP